MWPLESCTATSLNCAARLPLWPTRLALVAPNLVLGRTDRADFERPVERRRTANVQIVFCNGMEELPRGLRILPRV
jgi:hypothetical protein